MMKFIGTLCAFLILSCFSVSVTAKNVVMETKEDAEVFAYIGARYQKVATLFARQHFPLSIPDKSGDVLAVPFGNDMGFVPQIAFSIKSEIKSAVKKRGVLQGYVITINPTVIYSENNENAPQFAFIEADLRYPFIGTAVDKQGESWYQVELAGKRGYIKAKEVQPDNGIPILMYHHVLRDEENRNYRNTPTTVSDKALRFQFEMLKELGFVTIRLNSLEKYLQGKINLPAKAVVLTFDDGLKSVHRYAYPLLKEYGFTATLFVITSGIQAKPQDWEPDTLQFLSTSEYQAMQDITDLQSHSHSLHHYKNFKPAVLEADNPTMHVDLNLSKQELGKLNAKTTYLAYPFGAYTPDFLSIVKSSGFTLGLTTNWGKVRFADDPFLLKRIYFTSQTKKSDMIEALRNQ